MTTLAIFSLPHVADVALTLVTLAVGLVGGVALVALGAARRRRRRDAAPPGRILVVLTGDELPCAAVDAAGRLGRAERALVVPAVLLCTPYRLPLDCALREAGSGAMDLLEGVERRLSRMGVAVDGRVVQGRTRRHAIRRLVEQERFDRLVVPAAEAGRGGLGADDVAWLLAHVDGEVLVLRAASPGEDGGGPGEDGVRPGMTVAGRGEDGGRGPAGRGREGPAGLWGRGGRAGRAGREQQGVREV